MRPAHKTISAGRLDIREQAGIQTSEAALLEHPNWSFDRYRFAEDPNRFAASFIPRRGKG